jgi:carbamoyl-phosphate synthase large subunit
MIKEFLKNKLRIAVTGVGGGVGQSIIKCLKESNYDIIGLDSEKSATGLYMCDKSYIIPYAKDKKYIDSLLDICKKENVSILFPGLDAELSKLSKSRELFLKIGVNVIVSNKDVIDIANNKLRSYTFFKNNNFVKTKSYSRNNIGEFDFPVIIKQKKDGCRSKNILKIKSKREFNEFNKNKKLKDTELIICEYLDGEEYTCGSVSFEDKILGTIVMKRVLRNGDTYKCSTVKNTIIENYIVDLISKLKPYGACNVQLRLKENVPIAFEINARCSGTTAARSLCGFNEPLIIADYLVKKRKPKLDIKPLSIFRYWNEIVIDSIRFNENK